MQKNTAEKGYRVNPNSNLRQAYNQVKASLENMGLEHYSFGEFVEDIFCHTRPNLEASILEKRVPDDFKIKSALQDPKIRDAVLNLIGKKKIPSSIRPSSSELG